MGSQAETYGRVPVCSNFAVGGKKTAGGLRRLFTVQNGLLVVVALFQLGTLWERQRGLNDGLVSALASVRAEVAQMRQDLREEGANTYARKDVISIQLLSIEGRLDVIESIMREELRPVTGVRRFDR